MKEKPKDKGKFGYDFALALSMLQGDQAVVLGRLTKIESEIKKLATSLEQITEQLEDMKKAQDFREMKEDNLRTELSHASIDLE